MTRVKRGDRPSVDVLDDRFMADAAERVAGLIAAAGIRNGDNDVLIGVRFRPVGADHEIIAETAMRGDVIVGRIPMLEFSARRGELADEYLEELAATLLIDRGRPSERDKRTRRIEDAIRSVGSDARRDAIAAMLERTDEWGEPSGDYKADVRAAGGWVELKRKALAGE